MYMHTCTYIYIWENKKKRSKAPAAVSHDPIEGPMTSPELAEITEHLPLREGKLTATGGFQEVKCCKIIYIYIISIAYIVT